MPSLVGTGDTYSRCSRKDFERELWRNGVMTLRPLLPLAAAALALTACGSDSSSDAAAAVKVRATDYAFLDLPDRVASGTTFELSNTSDREAHELVAVRLPDDEERSVAQLVALPPEEFAPFMTEVRTVIVAGPQADGTAVVGDGTLDEPGRYAFICVIPTGADPDEYLTKAATSEGPPDVAGGPPHIAKGMFAEITVDG